MAEELGGDPGLGHGGPRRWKRNRSVFPSLCMKFPVFFLPDVGTLEAGGGRSGRKGGCGQPAFGNEGWVS